MHPRLRALCFQLELAYESTGSPVEMHILTWSIWGGTGESASLTSRVSLMELALELVNSMFQGVLKKMDDYVVMHIAEKVKALDEGWDDVSAFQLYWTI